MKVRLVAVTQPVMPDVPEVKTAEDLIVYAARVSSPNNQSNVETGERLLRYCIRKGHWSVFEQAGATFEIETSRAIAAQILRHRSFTFQELSQRYADVSDIGFEEIRPRRQDDKNRQSSHDDLEMRDVSWFVSELETLQNRARHLYVNALGRGIAKESARFLLPLSVTTRLFIKGSVRSWIHYLQARRAPETQLEHREVAEAVWGIFSEQFPTVAAAVSEVAS